MSGTDTVWRIRHQAVTGSTNKDALGGKPGDVFTADHQTAGRGRLDHQWLSPPGENLMMSAVIGVAGALPEEVATLPLVVGLSVAKAIESIIFYEKQQESFSPCGDRPCETWETYGDRPCEVKIKWPNDVLIDCRKVCGILCERKDDRVIAGLGVNVNQTVFAREIASRAISLRLALQAKVLSVSSVRDTVLNHLAVALMHWRTGGFRSVWPEIAARDFLKGKTITVRRTDDDAVPATGVCGGICVDGALDVAGEAIFAGEAHIVI